MSDDFQTMPLGGPLVFYFPDGTELRLARVTMRQWAKWKERLAGAARASVLKRMLADQPPHPLPVVYKTANEELTRKRSLPEVADFVATDAGGSIEKLLREQAVSAGHEKEQSRELVDRIGSLDQYELAGLLIAEASIKLPLLLPLARERARERGRMMIRQAAAAIAASVPAFTPQ